MKVVNAMFGKGLGGIEQAFLDYAESLAMLGHEVVCVVRPKAKIILPLQKILDNYPDKITIKKISSMGRWDPIAKFRIGKFLKNNKPDAVVVHGNRPASLFRQGTAKNKIPQVGVVHNYWFKDVINSDFLFCVSKDIRTKLISKYFKNDRVIKVPNLIRVGAEPNVKQPKEVPLIGVMGRMVEKKGVDIFLRSLFVLRKRGVKFKAIIGGDGDGRFEYQTLRDSLKLNDSVRFIGWVKDKQKFYNDIDIFCLPSLSEPFGIVLLEAMVNKKPIVSTNMEGPGEILTSNIDALLVDKGNYDKLADALEEAIKDNTKSAMIAEQGFRTAKNNYDISVVSKTLEKALETVLANY